MTTKSQDVRAALADRLSQGHAKGDAVPTTRRTRDAKLAATFRPDPRQERIAELRRTDRAAYDALPTSVRMGHGYYAEARAAHERTEANGDE